MPEILQQFDLNEDGRIDEEERQAAKARRQARAERRAAIEEWDTDGDGELSREGMPPARPHGRGRRFRSAESKCSQTWPEKIVP